MAWAFTVLKKSLPVPKDAAPCGCALGSGCGASAARVRNWSTVTTSGWSGASRMRARRCGRSGVWSPLAARVPYNFQIRAALKTPVSTLTGQACPLRSSNFSARALRQDSMRVLLAESLGRSTRYSRCAPLPESARTGRPQPWAVNQSRICSALTRAAACSASLLEIPAGRTGSRSTSIQRRTLMSGSAVVCLSCPAF